MGALEPLEAQIPIGTIVAEKYRIERVLGEGGMGIVVEARHIELEQRVALKFLRPAPGYSDAVARFRLEARALAKVRSEHVTRILDIGALENGTPYLVMEFLDGHDLAAELRDRPTLPAEEAVDYMLQAIEAIAEAHALGIVHRDLKPGNLFIAHRADRSKLIKVLDFGVAKSLTTDNEGDLGLTRGSMQIGSPLYMSPEQMRSAAAVDQRTDIWALGIILYRVLTGQFPFSSARFLELREAVENTSPLPVAALNADVPEALSNVVMRCLEKKPDQRYASVDELARDLADFGPTSSRVHAERAGRVMKDALASQGSQPGQRDVAASDGVTPRGANVEVLDRPPTVLRTQPVSRTLSDWEKSASPRHARSTKLRLAAAVLGVAGVVVFASSMWQRQRMARLSDGDLASRPSAAAPAVETVRKVEPPFLLGKPADPVPSATVARAPALTSARATTKVQPKRPLNKPVRRSVSDFGGRR
jgi:serine/threonine-protein kinase